MDDGHFLVGTEGRLAVAQDALGKRGGVAELLIEVVFIPSLPVAVVHIGHHAAVTFDGATTPALLVADGLVVTAVIVAYIGKNTVFKGEAVPFVMELPNYRMPLAKNVLRLMWDKAKDFLQRAFTIIFTGTIIIWCLGNFDFRLNMVDDPESSILAMLAGFIAPVMAPVGLGDWRICVSLVSGFMAKESVVSTLEVLFGTEIGMFLTPLAAVSMLVFSLLYTPCVATVASVKRELGAKWAVCLVLWQCLFAWLITLIIRAVCILVGVV